VNTLSFIGNIAPKTERVWKEVDEEMGIIGCKESFDRPRQFVKPLMVLQNDLPGVIIELMHCRTGNADGHWPAGFCETQIQVQNKRVTRTPEGDFELSERDVLIVPPNISGEHFGHGPDHKAIVYTRTPVGIAQRLSGKGERRAEQTVHTAQAGDGARQSHARRLRRQAL
jgi:hypothetical protein